MIRVEAADQGALDRATKMLAGIDGGLRKAVKSAASRSTQHLRTQSTKAIRERYAISQSNIRSNENIRVKYDYANGVQATVTFGGHKIPLARYSGTTPAAPSYDSSRLLPIRGSQGWAMMHPGVPAKAHQLKGTAPTTFQSGFVAKFSSGHIGIFERTGGATSTGSDEIRELMGSSVPQMLGSEEVQEDLAKDTMDKFEERLDHEVLAILNGWR